MILWRTVQKYKDMCMAMGVGRHEGERHNTYTRAILGNLGPANKNMP
jgi:hypothetical protein